MARAKSYTRFGNLLGFGGLFAGGSTSDSGRRKAGRPMGRRTLAFETLDRRELFSGNPVTSAVPHSPTVGHANLPVLVQTITSPDGKDQASIYELNGSYTVEENGKVVATTTASISDLMFSPAGDHLLFVETSKSKSSPTGVTCSVVEDGKVVGSGPAIEELTFSKDGKDLAFVEEGFSGTTASYFTNTVIENGKVVGGYDGPIKNLQFSPVGDQLVYVAYTPSNISPTGYVAWVVDNGNLVLNNPNAGINYTYDVEDVMFSPGSNQLTFVADSVSASSPTGHTASLVENGKVVATTNDNIDDVTFSSDGKHLAFVEVNESANGKLTFSVIEDGKTVSGPSSKMPGGLSFQGDKLVIG